MNNEKTISERILTLLTRNKKGLFISEIKEKIEKQLNLKLSSPTIYNTINQLNFDKKTIFVFERKLNASKKPTKKYFINK